MTYLANNQYEVVCKNKACPTFGEKRVVSLPLLGGNSYLIGSIRCLGCHQEVDYIERVV